MAVQPADVGVWHNIRPYIYINMNKTWNGTMKDNIANEWTLVRGFKDRWFFVCIVFPTSWKYHSHIQRASMQRFCLHWMSEILPIPTWGAAVVLNGYNHGDNFSNLGYEAPYNSGDSGVNMGVSKNRGTPKLSILMGFSIINHPFGDIHHFRTPPYKHPRYYIRLCSPAVAGPQSLAMRWNCHPSGTVGVGIQGLADSQRIFFYFSIFF